MRIPVLAARDGGLETRDENKKRNFVYIVVIAVSIFVILAITYVVTRRYNRKNNPAERTSKADKLPRLFRWPWQPRRHKYSNTLQEEGASGNMESREMTASTQINPEQPQDVTGVDRNTSVRSVMTLPAYSPAARANETILGREGERGGIDTVLEFPETGDDEEARREGEMESLYQIRLARRQEAREREERRQARREARARGDQQALAEIRRRAEAANELSVSQALIAEHQGANRDRRVSSVAYGDLGVARHDGTRLRANSTESDNRPLLDSAASISGQSSRSRALSTNTLNTHRRGPSSSSLMSSRESDDFEFPDAIHITPSHDTDDFEVVSLSHPRSRSASRVATPLPSPSIDIPRENAPAYEDPPDYESPVATRAPMLPALDRLPSIQVTPEPLHGDGRSSSPR